MDFEYLVLCIYNLIILGTTVWLVGWHSWDPWWFAFALLCCAVAAKDDEDDEDDCDECCDTCECDCEDKPVAKDVDAGKNV